MIKIPTFDPNIQTLFAGCKKQGEIARRLNGGRDALPAEMK